MEFGVQRWQQPDYSIDPDGSTYAVKIDRAIAAAKRPSTWFAPHQAYLGSPAPDLSVELDAGFIWNSGTLAEVAAQSVAGFTIPSAGQHVIDRVVVDAQTGAAERVAGTAVTGSPSASPPAIPAGKIPICQVLISSSNTVVTNSMIGDERVFPTEHGVPRVLYSGQASAVSALLLSFLSYLSVYRVFEVLLEDYRPGTDDTELHVRVSTNVGSPVDAGASQYGYAAQAMSASPAAATPVSSAETHIKIGHTAATEAIGNAATESLSGKITIHNPSNATAWPKVSFDVNYINANATATHCTERGGGHRRAAQDVDSIELTAESGTFSTRYCVIGYGF